jgi:class 3 adenylate cyclase
MREAIRGFKDGDLLLKIGIHEGPCLAVTLNDRLDYFGQTVNIAARVQGLADSHAIFASGSVVEHPEAARLLRSANLQPAARSAALRGIANELTVYEIP